MPKFYVTKTIHIATEVYAETADEAVDIAQNKDINDWDFVDEDQALAFIDNEEE